MVFRDRSHRRVIPRNKLLPPLCTFFDQAGSLEHGNVFLHGSKAHLVTGRESARRWLPLQVITRTELQAKAPMDIDWRPRGGTGFVHRLCGLSRCVVTLTGARRGIERDPRRRVREMAKQLEETTTVPMHQRLARKIVLLVERWGTVEREGMTVSLRLSQQELASLADTTRQSVNKHLRRWKREGVLAHEAGRLVVCDLDRLKQIAVARSQ